MFKHLLWDLDGTLTDPKNGIIRSIQYALKEFDMPVPEESDLLWCIGPPLHHSFALLVPGLSEQEAWKFIEKYRERFATVGLFENAVYENIPALLMILKDRKNFVATSKPQVYASQIINHFKLDPFFLSVYGSELDGTRSDKGDLIQFILETEKISRNDVVMIGDRKYDILGAKKAGIAAIGVSWGYGSEEELKNSGAEYIFSAPADLQLFLAQ